MLITPPKKGTVVFEYIPVNLNSYRKAYGKVTWFDLDYCLFRLKSGLLYATEAEVLERIAFEKKQMQERVQKINEGNV